MRFSRGHSFLESVETQIVFLGGVESMLDILLLLTVGVCACVCACTCLIVLNWACQMERFLFPLDATHVPTC